MKYSPFNKATKTWYMGYSLPRSIPLLADDEVYEIPLKYNQQPWRLAKERYGDERLYYIFALANPNIISDPIFDFTAGKKISIPTKSRIDKYIGG